MKIFPCRPIVLSSGRALAYFSVGMSNRIDATFEKLRSNSEKAFVAYVSAGDPDLDRSLEIMVALAEAGADSLATWGDALRRLGRRVHLWVCRGWRLGGELIERESSTRRPPRAR